MHLFTLLPKTLHNVYDSSKPSRCCMTHTKHLIINYKNKYFLLHLELKNSPSSDKNASLKK